MKRLVSISIALMLIVAMTGCQGQNNISANAASEKLTPLTTEQKISDFEGLYKVLEENYPFFEVNKRMHGIDWLANKNKYIEMIKTTKTDDEYLTALRNILKDLNNLHVGIADSSYYYHYKELIASTQNMPAWLKQMESPNTVTRYSHMDTNTAKQQPMPNQQNKLTKANVASKILIDNEVAYLEISSLDFSKIEEDMKIIKPFLESIKDYRVLIIDIRGNGGGSESYWSRNIVPMLIDKPLSYATYFVYRGGDFSKEFINNKLNNDISRLKPIKEINKEKLLNSPPELLDDYKYYYKSEDVIQPNNSVGFKGKIYLLVDKQVYSSSEAFASFAKSTGFATLVGETTGGDGIGQDPLYCSLPKSGYLMVFPFVMGLTDDGTCDEEHKTVPDIEVFAEKMKDMKKDPAIQYVLKLYK